MKTVNQDMKKTETPENTVKLNKKIKETWSRLGDEDVKLYDKSRDQFFAKLKEKQNVSREDGEKRMKEIEESCGCGTAKAA